MTNQHQDNLETGYTVSKEIAERCVAKYPEQRLMAMERRSQGGWGVWELDGSFWVYVNLSDGGM